MLTIHVAVGVIENAQGEILISKRADEVHQGGLWEFPGGKVEQGESVQQALGRELQEELGIVVGQEGLSALMEIHHDYGDKQVFLDIWWVRAFTGEARGAEGQPVRWVKKSELNDFAFPQANIAIIERLTFQV